MGSPVASLGGGRSVLCRSLPDCSQCVSYIRPSALAVALLTLNPLVLDFLVAARGYGIALALFTYALVLLVRWGQNEKDRRPASLVKAGIALGLSVAANL